MRSPRTDCCEQDCGGGSCADKIIENLAQQTEYLCHVRGHITPVIMNLDIDEDWFTGYSEPRRATYHLEGAVQMFLYQYVGSHSQSELARLLRGATHVYGRFGFRRSPTQQIISHNWRNRFTPTERRTIKEAAQEIREICDEHGLLGTTEPEPALDPDDLLDDDISEDLIMDAVDRATELGFQEFTADRADNAKYALEAYFERQGYLNMTNAGTTTDRRRFARLSERDEVPHGSSHNRTMKKVATPDPQTRLDEYEDGRGLPRWKEIRDEVLPAFHAGVERQLDEIAGRDREGLREPVKAALDITYWNFWSSPYRSEEDVDWSEKPTEITYQDGSTREVYLKNDYPEMVSGLKGSHKRGYKFATLTIVAEDTPIVLAIEPVRDKRNWEKAKDLDVQRTSRGELVERLLEQARQHIEIHKVFADREFDAHAVRDVINRSGIQYVIGKEYRSKADAKGVQKTVNDPILDAKVEHAELTVDGRTHDVSIMYVPKKAAKGNEDLVEDDYVIFTTNAEVSPDRAQALTGQYRHRWEIENQYKMIKKHFLPTCASKDYRLRFLYFTIGVIMYNVWRLANFVLRDEVDINLGEKPPLRAGEIVELVAFCLFDPGD